MKTVEDLRSMREALHAEDKRSVARAVLEELLDDLIARRGGAASGIVYGTSVGAIDTSGMTGDGGTVSWPTA